MNRGSEMANTGKLTYDPIINYGLNYFWDNDIFAADIDKLIKQAKAIKPKTRKIQTDIRFMVHLRSAR